MGGKGWQREPAGLVLISSACILPALMRHYELIATVAADEVPVTIEPSNDGRFRVRIGERTYLADAREIRPGTWSLLVQGRSYLIDLQEDKRGATLIGRRGDTRIAIEDARRKRLAKTVAAGERPRGEVVMAPIAGKVVKILVSLGDEVAAGQPVAVLEAMKMENEIKAEHGGKTHAIHVTPGQSVETNDKIVTLA